MNTFFVHFTAVLFKFYLHSVQQLFENDWGRVVLRFKLKPYSKVSKIVNLFIRLCSLGAVIDFIAALKKPLLSSKVPNAG